MRRMFQNGAVKFPIHQPNTEEPESSLNLPLSEGTVGCLSRITRVSVNSAISLPTPSPACSRSWIGGAASSLLNASTVIPVFKRFRKAFRAVEKLPKHEGSEPKLLLRDVRFHLLLKITHCQVRCDDISRNDVSRNIGGQGVRCLAVSC